MNKNIAIFGGTSQIGKDLVSNFMALNDYNLFLYSRRPQELEFELGLQKYSDIKSLFLEQFDNNIKFDVIINLIGAGDPEKIKSLGASIFNVTNSFDDFILNYLNNYNNKCKYIFFSSGAVYGNSFKLETDKLNETKFFINNLNSEDYYGLAKLQAEIKHRINSNLCICDLRVFGYFSESQNLKKTFLMSQIANCILEGSVFFTSDDVLYRDYIHPVDLFDLILLIIKNYSSNGVVDCYSKNPIEKNDLLIALQEKMNLKFQIIKGDNLIENNRYKGYYYSVNKSFAENLGYEPKFSSLEAIVDVMDNIIKNYEFNK